MSYDLAEQGEPPGWEDRFSIDRERPMVRKLASVWTWSDDSRRPWMVCRRLCINSTKSILTGWLERTTGCGEISARRSMMTMEMSLDWNWTLGDMTGQIQMSRFPWTRRPLFQIQKPTSRSPASWWFWQLICTNMKLQGISVPIQTLPTRNSPSSWTAGRTCYRPQSLEELGVQVQPLTTSSIRNTVWQFMSQEIPPNYWKFVFGTPLPILVAIVGLTTWLLEYYLVIWCHMSHNIYIYIVYSPQ